MPPSSSSSVRSFLLQQEFPENALQKAQTSLNASEHEHCQDGMDTTSDGRGCACPHWRKYLPHRLDLRFCQVIQSKSETEEDVPRVKDAPRTAWVPQNPVHGLHFQSLLDQPLDSFYSDEAPVLFGDEQERLIALKTEGLAESWHPWIEPSDPSPVAFIGHPPPRQPRATSSASSDRNRAAKGPSSAATAIAIAENDAKTDTLIPVVAPSKSCASASEIVTSAPVAAAEPSSLEPASIEPSLEPASIGNPSPQIDGATATLPPDENSSQAMADSNPPSSLSPVVAPALAVVDDPVNESEQPPPTVPTESPSNSSVIAVNATVASSSTVEATAVVAPETVSSAETAPTPDETTQPSSSSSQEQQQQSNNNMYLLPEAAFSSWHTAEDQIRLIRHAFLSKRHVMLPVKRKSKSGTKANETASASKGDKKRKPDSSHPGGGGSSLQAMLSDWKLPQHQPLLSIDPFNGENSSNNDSLGALQPSLNRGVTLDTYEAQQHRAARTVELWMEHFRSSRMTYWKEQKQRQQQQQKTRQSSSMAEPQSLTPHFRSALTAGSVFGTIARNSTNNSLAVNVAATAVFKRCCQECRQLRSGVLQRRRDGQEWLSSASEIAEEVEDGYPRADDDDLLFQCLECSFIGCAPASVSSGKQTRQHMTLHFLQSNHNFGAYCNKTFCCPHLF